MKKAFDEELYKKTGINGLIIFCINSVSEREEKCTFERLLKECFTFFPKTFCFVSHSNWPDARKLDRPLRSLRDRKVIVGDPSTDFSLTKLGKQMAADIGKTFRQKKLFK